MGNSDSGKCSCGMEPNVAGLLCYLVGWISGLIFFLIEKENKFVRFHALQSLIVFGGLNVLAVILSFIPVLVFLAIPLGLFGLVLWVFLMFKAYKGLRYKLPFIGDIADDYA